MNRFLYKIAVYALFLGGSFQVSMSQRIHPMILEGYTAGSEDFIYFYVWNRLYDITSQKMHPDTIYATPVIKGHFKLKVDIGGEAVYCSFSPYAQFTDAAHTPYLSFYLAESSDSLSITIDTGYAFPRKEVLDGLGKSNVMEAGIRTIHFSGKGAEKFSAQYAADLAEKRCQKNYNKRYKPTCIEHIMQGIRNMDNNFKLMDATTNFSLKTLAKWKGLMTPDIYRQLVADRMGKIIKEKNDLFLAMYDFYTGNEQGQPLLKKGKSLTLLSEYYLKQLKQDNARYGGKMSINSAWQISAVIATAWSDAAALSDHPSVFRTLSNHYKGPLRDKLLTAFFVTNYTTMKEMDCLLMGVLPSVKDSMSRQVLLRLAGDLQTGSAAYDFCLPDKYGNLVWLHNLKGKIVVIDFWFSNCGACLQYYQRVLKGLESYYSDNKDIIFLTISIDNDIVTWKKTLADKKMTSEQAINLYGGGERLQELRRRYHLTGYPCPLVLDREGKVVSHSFEELITTDGLKMQLEAALTGHVSVTL